MLTNPTIVPLTKTHLDAMRVNLFGYSVRGIAAELNGETVGVAGVLTSVPSQAFSVMDDRLRKYPKGIIRAAHRFRELLRSYGTVYAIASEAEPNSGRFLEYVGFQYENTTNEGRVYRWQQQFRG